MRTIGEIKADIDALEASPSMYGNEWKVPKRNGLYGEFVRSFGIPIDRLEAICAAEREERLVVLPCKVGDTVYRVVSGFSVYTPHPVRYVTDERIKSTKRICEWIEGNDFGKTVFLTREAAEAALKGTST